MKAKSLTQQHLLRHPQKLERFDKVIIWSNEHRAWWRPNGRGYTTVKSEAGIYNIGDAWNRVSGCGPEKRIVLQSVYVPEEDTKEERARFDLWKFFCIEHNLILLESDLDEICRRVGDYLCATYDTVDQA